MPVCEHGCEVCESLKRFVLAMGFDEVKAEIDRLRAENERLKRESRDGRRVMRALKHTGIWVPEIGDDGQIVMANWELGVDGCEQMSLDDWERENNLPDIDENV